MNPKLCRADHLETGNKHGTSSKLATDNNNNKSVVSFVIHVPQLMKARLRKYRGRSQMRQSLMQFNDLFTPKKRYKG